MGCVLCNLIQISEKEEPFPSESARQMFWKELANDIAQNHPDLVRDIEAAMVRQGARPHLTEREVELLGYVAGGQTNQQIAKSMNIAVPTVKNHLAHIMEKLGATTRAHAVSLARSKYILPKEGHDREVRRLPVRK